MPFNRLAKYLIIDVAIRACDCRQLIGHIYCPNWSATSFESPGINLQFARFTTTNHHQIIKRNSICFYVVGLKRSKSNSSCHYDPTWSAQVLGGCRKFGTILGALAITVSELLEVPDSSRQSVLNFMTHSSPVHSSVHPRRGRKFLSHCCLMRFYDFEGSHDSVAAVTYLERKKEKRTCC